MTELAALLVWLNEWLAALGKDFRYLMAETAVYDPGTVARAVQAARFALDFAYSQEA